ncbi:hypothetical protein BDU57DRAFT_438280, partial [Ampelomyces quisqualis]
FAVQKNELTKFSWLAKFYAHGPEARIQRRPDVGGVVVGRPAPYFVVEFMEGVPNQENVAQLLESIYATMIARANSVEADDCRIPRETVYLARKNKPFRRNLKQVVTRKGIEENQSDAIEQAHLELEKVQASVVPSY